MKDTLSFVPASAADFRIADQQGALRHKKDFGKDIPVFAGTTGDKQPTASKPPGERLNLRDNAQPGTISISKIKKPPSNEPWQSKLTR